MKNDKKEFWRPGWEKVISTFVGIFLILPACFGNPGYLNSKAGYDKAGFAGNAAFQVIQSGQTLQIEDPFASLLADFDNNIVPPSSPAMLVDVLSSGGKIWKTVKGGEEIVDGVKVNHFTFKSAPVYKNGYHDDTMVYGLMAVPANTGPANRYPGILLCHGGSGTAQRQEMYNMVLNWAKAGYVAMACDLPAIAGDEANVSGGAWRTVPYTQLSAYKFTVTPEPKASWNYVSAATALKALTMLKTHPNVNPRKLGITGASLGGYMATFISGLAGNRLAAGFSLYGCGYYDTESAWVGSVFPEWLDCFDAGRRTQNLKANFYLCAAANDYFFRIPAVEATLASITNARSLNFQFAPNDNHVIKTPGGTTASPKRSFTRIEEAYFDYLLKGVGYPLPVIQVEGVPVYDPQSNLKITFSVTANRALSLATPKLYYSLSGGGWNAPFSKNGGRKWIALANAKSTRMAGKKHYYSITLPDSIVSQNVDWYLLVSDTINATTVSSHIYHGKDQLFLQDKPVVKQSYSLEGRNNQILQNVESRVGDSEIYVDPVNGSDSNPGNKGKPFRTIERARDEIRQNRSSMPGDITVWLRGGEYNYADRYTVRQIGEGEKAYTVRTSELAFNERDSGKDGHKIIYKAYPGERPVISGGKRVTSWHIHDTNLNIYKTNIGTGIDTRQLYVNGERAIVARSEGIPANLAFESAYGHTTTDTFMAGWKNVQDLEFVYYDQWVEFRIKVDQITVDNSMTTIKMNPPAWQFSTTGRYTKIRDVASLDYIENAYELLDSDGEWYLDRSTGDLFYKPRSGEDMTTADVVVPVVDELLTAKGSSVDNRFENVVFEGITFEYAGWLRPNIVRSNIFCATLRDVNRYPESAVRISTVRGITFHRNKFLRMGSVGLKMDNGVKDVTIAGNKFVDISGGAMTIEEPHFKPLDLANVVIKNNYIRRVGLEYTAVPGIYVAQGKNIYIGHNEICELPYNGMCVSMHGNSISEHVVIENNYVHDMGTMTKVFDVGAIYASGTNTLANSENPAFTVRGNYVRNETNGIGAIYADNGSTWWYAYNNVIDLRYSPPWKGGKEPVAMHTNWGERLRFVNNYVTTDKTDFWMPADIADKWKPETNSFQWNLYPNAVWPREAIGIIANAGLEEPYRDLWDTQAHFNLVLNPGFETRQENQVWIAEDARWTRTVGEHHMETTSAEVTPTKAGGYIYQTIAASKGLHYQVSAWVKSGSAGKFNTMLHAVIDEGSSAQMLMLDKAAIVADNWILLKGEFTCSGGELSVPVKLFVSTDSPAGTPYYLDDFKVIEDRAISKKMLREAIGFAKKLHDSAVEGTNAGEYSQGSKAGFLAGIRDADKVVSSDAGNSNLYFALKALYAHQLWFQNQKRK